MTHLIWKHLPISVLILMIGWFLSCQPMEEKKKVENGTPIDCTYSLPNLAQVNQFILQDPENAQLFQIRSQILTDSGRYSEALSDAKRALSINPKDLYNFVVVAKAHRGLGQIDSALSACYTAEREGFNDPDNYLLMGDLYLIIRQYPRSMEYLNKALKLAPFEPKIYFLKGLAYWETKDTTRAISNWQTAIEQDPNYADAYIRLANYFVEMRQFDVAEQYLRSGIRLRPTDAFLQMNMGLFLSKRGYLDSAIQSYQNALSLKSDLRLAQANLGLLWCDKRQYSEALPLLEAALPSDPKNTTLIFRLGQCYQQTGAYEKAQSEFEKVIALDKDWRKEAFLALEKVKKLKMKATTGLPENPQTSK